MKNCPKCLSVHYKPGIYCSRSCANSRVFSDLAKQKKSIANKNYNKSLDKDTKSVLIEKASVTRKINKKNKIQNEKFENLSSSEKRDKILFEQNFKCSECGIEQFWNNKPLKFHLDHISGKRTDETRKNLRMICPNCHSQTETYGGKNSRKINDKQIEDAISISENNYEVCGRLGISPSAHSYHRINKIRENMLR